MEDIYVHDYFPLQWENSFGLDQIIFCNILLVS